MAPTLPPLTREEEDRIDDIVRRFSLADVGALKGDEARRAVKEFEALGREAIPSLLRGLNKAAALKHSCPVLMISKKLDRLLAGTQDPVLLEYARDELAAGASRTPHAATLSDFRVKLMLRKNALFRFPPPAAEWYEKIPTEGLIQLARAEAGKRREAALVHLARRDGREALLGLARFGKSAAPLLEESIGRLSPSHVLATMEDKNAELRKAAIRLAATKGGELVPGLIERLGDDEAEVRAAARAALKKLSGEDFGPKSGSKGEVDAAKAKAGEWWKRKNGE